MKLFLPVFFFMILISSNLFSQNKIGQIAYAQWNVEEGKWSYHAFDDWTYDEEGREIMHAYRDTRYSVYSPTNNTQSISIYDAAGKIKENNTLYYDPDQWENVLRQFMYNSDGDQEEEWFTTTNSHNDNIYFYKNVFERDDIENRRSIKLYQKNEAGNSYLRSQTDSIFNDHNCLIEYSIINNYEDGSIHYGRKWKIQYTDDCQVFHSDFFRWNASLGSMLHEEQYTYEYSNDGKIMIITYLRYNESTNQWKTEYVTETEINDDGERVRYLVESYRNNSIDTTLQLTTYTSRNEVETFQQYEMKYTTEGKTLQRVRNDSFAYHYNLKDLIEVKEDFYQNYENTIFKKTTTYKYYCNGQLKSEVHGGETPYYRKDYRYFGGVDCPLAEGEGAMILFPNPTSGRLTIQANLFSNSEATIKVFSILGQEVFSEKINQMSYQYQLDLSSLESGHYVVSVSNENEKVSEKLVIF